MYTVTIESEGRDVRCSGLTLEEAHAIIEMFAWASGNIWVSFNGGPAWEYSDYPYL